MLALPAHGFVVLSAPKCASTALEEALAPWAEVMTRHHPQLKHMNVRAFHRTMAPMLHQAGYPRRGYEVVTLFRDPIDWLHSWWRYRQGPRLKRPGGRVDRRRLRQGLPPTRRWTGGMSFAEFATAYLDGSSADAVVRGRPARFLLTIDDQVGVDRVFAFERPEVWQGWFRERLGEDLDFGPANRSRVRAPLDLDAALRARLEEHFAPEYEVRARLAADGCWAGARGTLLGSPVG